jgi:hypothetical protein
MVQAPRGFPPYNSRGALMAKKSSPDPILPVTDSQILPVKAQMRPPPIPRDPEVSGWQGRPLASKEFAPAGPVPRRGRWRPLVAVALALGGAAAAGVVIWSPWSDLAPTPTPARTQTQMPAATPASDPAPAAAPPAAAPPAAAPPAAAPPAPAPPPSPGPAQTAVASEAAIGVPSGPEGVDAAPATTDSEKLRQAPAPARKKAVRVKKPAPRHK